LKRIFNYDWEPMCPQTYALSRCLL